MTDALAAVFQGEPYHHQSQRLPLPEPRRGEWLVRIVGATICGSDRHTYEGRRQTPVPTILGHEIVGEIIRCGPETPQVDLTGRQLATGDRITWAIVAHCGNCFYCDRGLPQKCLRAVKYGHERIREPYQLHGGFADHCLLAPGTSVMRLDRDLPLEAACPANCATATAAAALEAATVGTPDALRGRNLVVLGCGLLGLTIAAMAFQSGAATILTVDRDPYRRELSRKFGATHTVAPERLRSGVTEISPHGMDVMFEVTGNNEAFLETLPMLRIGAVAVLVGSVIPADPVPIRLEHLVRHQLTIRGIHNYAPRHLRIAVEFLSNHHRQFPFADLVTAWHPLSAIAAAFADAADPRNLRVGVRPVATE